ncbi:hypothetical protein CFC63_24480 (plasmid) [Salmonella enterica subsp. enterica serovar Bredeney]|nr:hypothetical protein CFC63_24480 [Salmonella enterica subsp. enterica serovar Bredeney]
MIDADNILFEGSEDLMAVRLVMNIEYLDMWIKKYDFNNYITEAFKTNRGEKMIIGSNINVKIVLSRGKGGKEVKTMKHISSIFIS